MSILTKTIHIVNTFSGFFFYFLDKGLHNQTIFNLHRSHRHIPNYYQQPVQRLYQPQ